MEMDIEAIVGGLQRESAARAEDRAAYVARDQARRGEEAAGTRRAGAGARLEAEGEWPAEITSARETDGKVQVKLTVTEGEQSGRWVWRSYVLAAPGQPPGKGEAGLEALARSVGAEREAGRAELVASLKGRRLLIRTKAREWQGQRRLYVASIAPAGLGARAEPAEAQQAAAAVSAPTGAARAGPASGELQGQARIETAERTPSRSRSAGTMVVLTLEGVEGETPRYLRFPVEHTSAAVRERARAGWEALQAALGVDGDPGPLAGRSLGVLWRKNEKGWPEPLGFRTGPEASWRRCGAAREHATEAAAEPRSDRGAGRETPGEGRGERGPEAEEGGIGQTARSEPPAAEEAAKGKATEGAGQHGEAPEPAAVLKAVETIRTYAAARAAVAAPDAHAEAVRRALGPELWKALGAWMGTEEGRTLCRRMEAVRGAPVEQGPGLA